MKFKIEVDINKRKYRYTVEQVHQDNRIERYKVSGKDRSIVLESNRLLFRNRGLRYRKPNWTIYQGAMQSRHALEAICKAIESYLDER